MLRTNISFRADQWRKMNEIRAWTGKTISETFRDFIDRLHRQLEAKRKKQ